ncbi:DUF6526 family protein [Chitinophaga sancti]|uniref:DUF6526 family protein n=1 Tax=Chitinophaga sancti TaxID=1004 RepID=UPI002A74F759|nr:DUF6526 family protein [Chitinophaga sancti]WPQ63480.1 DUF6526 family protein [Chitinophaga sancti]
MKKQNYQNHIRYYPPHHFVFYPVLLVGIICSIFFAIKHPDASWEWIFITLLLLLIGWLGFMLRQHYALTTQDRIVRLEVRFRYFTLTGQRFELLEKNLSLGQILALRFASDGELPDLVKRAVAENLPPDQIKRAVVDWQGDYMRV